MLIAQGKYGEAIIYMSCISEHTLDECPAAYKDAEEIIERISDTCTIEQVITPLYNFKA